MAQSFAMNGGDGEYSYTKNSIMQRDVMVAVKDMIKEAVIENLDVEKLVFGPGFKTLAIADLGCSVGPNTFYAVETLIEAVKYKYSQESRNDDLEFQVWFNDRIGNDFNTLFASLPNPRDYFVGGVPGSFHGSLFPSASLHIAYSSTAIHWLSKVPVAVEARESLAWNAGKIHSTGASDAVVRAYEDQFEEDMGVFLRERAREIANGGLVVIIVPGLPHRDVEHLGCKMVNFIESIFMDMVKEGVLEQEQVDSFNIATLYPCVEDMRRAVDQNGSFEVVKIELMEISANLDPEIVIPHLRAALEGTIANHFGKEIVDRVFGRALQSKLEFTRFIESSPEIGFNGQLRVVLKRKDR